MKSPKSLTDSWLKSIQTKVDESIPDPSRFNDQFDNLLVELARAVAEDSGRQELLKNPYNTKKQIRERYSNLFDSHDEESINSWQPDGFKHKLKKSYAAVFYSEKYLSDTRRQEDWATSWDHFKAFLFRLLTAIMIAGVVLATGYYANRIGIPIPMLRGL
ncbi:MAG: hypothetical protein ABIS30_07520 [Gallionella sp.]